MDTVLHIVIARNYLNLFARVSLIGKGAGGAKYFLQFSTGATRFAIPNNYKKVIEIISVRGRSRVFVPFKQIWKVLTPLPLSSFLNLIPLRNKNCLDPPPPPLKTSVKIENLCFYPIIWSWFYTWAWEWSRGSSQGQAWVQALDKAKTYAYSKLY